MPYFQLAIMAAVAIFVLRSCHDVKVETQKNALAQIEKQVAASADDAEKDAARETKRLLALRPARQAEIVKTQAKRKGADVKQKTVDPVYSAWSDGRVPDYVTNSLHDSATASGGLYLSPSDRQSSVVVQPDNPAPVKADAKPGVARLRLGPARPN